MSRQTTIRQALFHLETTLKSGQAFLWQFQGGSWSRVLNDTPVMLRQHGDELDISLGKGDLTHEDVMHYLGINDDLDVIWRQINRDPIIAKAIDAYKGLRIMRQDPWECMITFLCATNTNMRNIELMLSRLASHLGVRHDLNGRRLYGLPSPAAVAKSSRRILTECGLGYRAEAVLQAACSIQDGNFDLGRIKTLSYDSAHRTLAGESQNTPHPYGVGPKVADCILLFAFEMLEAFPIDVWIARAINKYYDRIISKEAANALRRHVDRTGTLTRTRYREISRAMRNYFGEYAGQAQQHLFIASRSNVI